VTKDNTRIARPALLNEMTILPEEETLIEDRRASIRPAQSVEEKLVAALEAGPVYLSQLQQLARPHGR